MASGWFSMGSDKQETTNTQPTTTGRAVSNLGGTLTQQQITRTTTLDGGSVQANPRYSATKGGRIVIHQGVGQDALQGILDATTAQVGSLRDALAGAGDASADTLSAVLGKLGELAESKQTDGESGKDKRISYMVIALLAVVAFIFWNRK